MVNSDTTVLLMATVFRVFSISAYSALKFRKFSSIILNFLNSGAEDTIR